MAKQKILPKLINHRKQLKENKSKAKKNHEDMVRNAHANEQN